MISSERKRLERIRNQLQTMLNQTTDLNKMGMEEFKDLTKIVVEARWSVLPDMQEQLEMVIRDIDHVINEKK